MICYTEIVNRYTLTTTRTVKPTQGGSGGIWNNPLVQRLPSQKAAPAQWLLSLSRFCHGSCQQTSLDSAQTAEFHHRQRDAKEITLRNHKAEAFAKPVLPESAGGRTRPTLCSEEASWKTRPPHIPACDSSGQCSAQRP